MAMRARLQVNIMRKAGIGSSKDQCREGADFVRIWRAWQSGTFSQRLGRDAMFPAFAGLASRARLWPSTRSTSHAGNPHTLSRTCDEQAI